MLCCVCVCLRVCASTRFAKRHKYLNISWFCHPHNSFNYWNKQIPEVLATNKQRRREGERVRERRAHVRRTNTINCGKCKKCLFRGFGGHLKAIDRCAMPCYHHHHLCRSLSPSPYIMHANESNKRGVSVSRKRNNRFSGAIWRWNPFFVCTE